VIPDFVAGRRHFARRFRQTPDIGPTLKECGAYVIAFQDFEQARGGFAGPVIERERDRRSAGHAPI
jgi:hypothetical protein